MTSGRRLVAAVATAITALSYGAPAAAQVAAEDLEVIIAIDASGSMGPAIESAKAAANEFVVNMPPDVRIGVETFADVVQVLSDPTTDRQLLVERIGSIETGGDTALYDVVVGASQHFSANAEHRVLVVLSDGRDEGSVASLDDAIAATEGLHVEAISLTTAETDLTSLLALGTVTPADDPAGVSAAFARISDLIVEVVETTTSAAPTTTTTVAPSTTASPTTVAASTTVAAAPPTVVSPPSPNAAVETAAASTSTVRLWIGAGGLFVGLFALALILFPRERVSKARLGIDKPRTVSDMGVRTVTAIEEALERHGKRAELGTSLAVAGIAMKPAEFVAMVGFIALVAGMVGLLLGGLLVALAVTALVCLGVKVYVSRAKTKRQVAFADQLPDVLRLVTTALRSGFGLTQALESVAEEAEEPARSEFAQVLVESRLGRDLSESMHALARRMESKDLEWIVSAIDINRETGGNLSEILDTVSLTIRERGRIARHVRTLTAEGRLSARILTAFPLLLLVWQWRANPDNFGLLLHGVGLVMLIIAGILILLGSMWVHRIVNSVSL